MPDNRQEPSHALMRMVAADGPWADRLVPVAKTRGLIGIYSDYYRWLRPLSRAIEIWQTTYVHPLPGRRRGRRLVPRQRFAAFPQSARRMRARGVHRPLHARASPNAYPAEPDGRLLFLYPRLFVVAAKRARAVDAQARRRRARRDRAFCEPRAARAAIEAGLVASTASLLRKASEGVAADAAIEARAAHPWVSRGGVKLAAALDAFALDPRGLDCLDVGASTGGFTDVLLARGARRVTAVDVGHGQFDARLAATIRGSIVLEGRDARRLDAGDVRGAAGGDRLRRQLHLAAAGPAARPARSPAPRAWLVALIKPQFEVGRAASRQGRGEGPGRPCAGLRGRARMRRGAGLDEPRRHPLADRAAATARGNSCSARAMDEALET